MAETTTPTVHTEAEVREMFFELLDTPRDTQEFARRYEQFDAALNTLMASSSPSE